VKRVRFDEEVAARYDENSVHMNRPEVLDRAVDFLAELAGDGAALDGSFRLAYLVFNTITNLTTQDEQVACFRNAAAHLEPGGCFVVGSSLPLTATAGLPSST
jgi:hypothetical protein